tara:strand:- start:3755 stop:4576 length:822 start_codon:yes stop_codon:yes gene_type:complete
MKIHSYGCSFVVGNGVNAEVEKSLPNHYSKGDSDIKRKYRENLSFTGQLAKLMDCEYNNFGKSGSNPNYLLDLVIKHIDENMFTEDDLVICCFTSPLRNRPEFFPSYFESRSKIGMEGLTFGLKELAFHKRNEYWQLKNDTENSTNLAILDYRREFLAKYFDFNSHFDYYSQNVVFLLQYLFDLYKINHIFIDAFDTFISNDIYDKTEYIDKNKYWMYKEESIWSYLNLYNDKELFEREDLTDTLHDGKLHPSAKGHGLIATDLYKFYKTNYE